MTKKNLYQNTHAEEVFKVLGLVWKKGILPFICLRWYYMHYQTLQKKFVDSYNCSEKKLFIVFPAAAVCLYSKYSFTGFNLNI